MSKKVFLIGIDGGTFDIINPLVEKGDLPNIGEIMKEGTSSSLTSTFPPTTIPAWPSSVTGVNPGKLGINSFMKNIHDYESEWLVSMDDIKAKSIWHYLEKAGKKSIVVNIPYLYPPQKINGIMVSYFNTRRLEDSISATPETVGKELFDVLDIESLLRKRKEFGYISSSASHGGKSHREFWFDRLVAMHKVAVEKLEQATLHLMTKYDWDFFMVVFNSTDFLQHRLWGCMDKESPVYDESLAGTYGEEIFNCYRRVDKAVGEIRKRLDKDTSVILMSDHGFSPLKKVFFVNKWLKEKGFLHLKDGSEYKLARVSIPLYRILTKLKMIKIVSVLPQKIKGMEIPAIWRKPVSFSERIDWQKTRAYAHNDCININLRGREPMGIVDEEEYSRTVDLLKRELYDLSDDETGRKIVSKAFEKHEIYHGPFVEKAGDLYYFFDPPFYRVNSQPAGKNGIFRGIDINDKISGAHHSSFNGIFIACGPEISSEKLPDSPHIMDLAPTVLYLLGIAVPNEMDGRVVTEIIDRMHLESNPVMTSDESVLREGMQTETEGFTQNDSEQVKDLLKDLGYFD